MDKLSASIIIPLWNGRKYIETCLAALAAQEYAPLEVIVVDNASGDGSAGLVAEKFPWARLICNQQNLGFAGGCNAGLRVAQGDILVLLNQDTEVYPGWLGSLCRALQDENIGVAGCKILYPDGKTIQHAGAWIEWPVGIPYHYGNQEQDRGQWDEPGAVEYVTGAALAFRRDVLDRVGLLDEMFWPGYFEDIDFCFRAREAGYEIWYIPDAVTLHQETTSTVDPQLLSQFYHRGRLRFLLKHLPPERFLAEFVPAEEVFQSKAIRGKQSKALRLVYTEAMATAAPVLLSRQRADRSEIEAIITALQKLEELAWTQDWQVVEETIPSFSGFTLDGHEKMPVDQQSPVPSLPPLRIFEPRSKVSILGPLITRFRRLWYNIAARWAVTYLTQQQEVINQRNIHYIRALERRLAELAEQNTILAAEVAKLQLNITRTSHEAGGE